MTGELFYAILSARKQERGDFAGIADNSKLHLAVALTLLTSQFALGLLVPSF